MAQKSKRSDGIVRKYFVGGNWKLNGTRESVKKLVDVLNAGDKLPENSSVQVIVAPTALHIEYCMNNLRKDFALCAQNVSTDIGYGAFTGELSAKLFSDWGVTWTIAGHSERRRRMDKRKKGHNEGESSVANKTRFALDAGMNVIVCCGEDLSERRGGMAMEVILSQLQAVLDVAKVTPEEWKRIVIAYEPVWAIGTGVSASPEQAQAVHEKIRWWLMEKVNALTSSHVRIIYGGSVKPKNASEIISKEDVDGFLVGGASLSADFIKVIKSVPAEFDTTTRDAKRQKRIAEIRDIKLVEVANENALLKDQLAAVKAELSRLQGS